jgi:hypothetical protein
VWHPEILQMEKRNKERTLTVIGNCIAIAVLFLICFILVATIKQRNHALRSNPDDARMVSSDPPESEGTRKQRRKIVIGLLFPVQGAETNPVRQYSFFMDSRICFYSMCVFVFVCVCNLFYGL